ncbi:hypothetical protein KGF54_004560 [Candida jiufengensis]|uniref:uncharacterized protein n=1 Tax=Candida jiufengensis TaxID=497108 RepID=UPI0022243483|nr:uncharacterized protein KGF54_004560 [Candida jiufengensis]KAI5951486.1 hypothetical protein KGF54_004560 [Candida jiufengensis]
MIIRRSRGIILFVGILLLHFSILFYIKLQPIKKFVLENVNIPKMRSYITSTTKSNKDYLKFDSNLINTVQDFKLKFNDDNSKLNDILKDIQFKDQSFDIINIPLKENLPFFQQYDPRFTFGLLLKYINENFETLSEIPTFHWSDYTDMSILEEYLFNPTKKECKFFDVTKKNPKTNEKDDLFKTNTYCIQDNEIETILNNEQNYDSNFIERIKDINANKLDNQLTTGFHIFSFSGRNKKALRPIIARSYLYDFMRNPLSLTFLLPNDKSIQYNINPNNRNSIKDTQEIFQDGEINMREEIQKLSNKLESSFNTLPYEKQLQHEQFIDNTVERINMFNAKESLNQTDQNYLNSLKHSIQETNPPKYFREANIIKKESNYGIGGHYDWRFVNGIINGTPKQEISIHGLVKAFLKLTNQYNLNTWVAHGSLLSWYWNGLQFPWDGDVDVQMPIDDLHKLSQLFNQTVVVDFGNDPEKEIRYGRYFLDSSSIISQRVRGNGNNNIDARFIDLDTGLYIDITGLAISDTHAPVRYNSLLANTPYDRSLKDQTISQSQRNVFLQVYNCRNVHFTRLEDLSPLKLSLVEGEYGYIPSNFEKNLLAEYGDKSLNEISYRSFLYIPRLRLWLNKDNVVDFISNGNKEEADKLKKDSKSIILNLKDDQIIEYLYKNLNQFKNFLLTNNLTRIHQNELNDLFYQKSTKSLFYDFESNEENLKPNLRTTLRHDYFSTESKAKEYNFEKEIERLKLLKYNYDQQIINLEKFQKSLLESTPDSPTEDIDGVVLNADGKPFIQQQSQQPPKKL